MAAKKPATPARSRAASKAKPEPVFVIKAADTGASDADILVGTIADANSQRLPNMALYWLLYENHPWIRACVRLVANAVAQEGFMVAKAEGEDYAAVTVEDDPRVGEIYDFFRGPAFNGKTFRAVIKATSTDLEVFGCAYWHEREQGDLLWYERWDPRLIVPVLSPDRTEIQSYKIKRSVTDGNSVIVDSAQTLKEIDAKEVVRFALEGGDPVLGAPSPLEALDLTCAMDLNIRKHRNAYFQNYALGGTYIIIPDANEDTLRNIEKQFRSMKAGVRNAYKPIILATGGDKPASVVKTNDSGKQEVDFIKGSELVRDEICAVYSVPPGKLSNTAGAMGQAGKGEDDETFEQDCVLPLEELIYETLTHRVLLQKFEIEDLALIPKRRSKMRVDMFDAAMSLVKFGGTGNEARALVGLPPVSYDPDSDPPENKAVADGMNLPLFVTVRGQSVAEDAAGAQPVAQQGSDNGRAGSANTAGKKKQQDEVGQKAGSRFPFGY